MERDKPQLSDDDQGFVHPDPVTDAALNWLFILQAEPDDQRLRAEFEAWRDFDPAHAKAFTVVEAPWHLPEMDKVAANLAVRTGQSGPRHDAAIAQFSKRKRSLWMKTWMAAAAVVLIAVGIQQYPVLMLQWRADYQTATGALEEITLPDGSLMTLNTASAVSLDFEGTKRAVRLLQGEAYFDVVHDQTRPFTVTAAFSEVEVKGTAFSVRTESEEDTVVLERGHVDVARLPQRIEMASLDPGDSITASATRLSAVIKTDPELSLAWRKGMILFEDRPFGQVLQEVGRYYNHSILVVTRRLDTLGSTATIVSIIRSGRYVLSRQPQALPSPGSPVEF
ncbi:FecR family protein [Xylophilus sp.]|uniref:FecR family protein n=1 Tax=Xylophilus sp. TaxID=2653893 RepID=UPI002D80D46A|nr:FecR domain-containing protein [Xylophilus sp.]